MTWLSELEITSFQLEQAAETLLFDGDHPLEQSRGKLFHYLLQQLLCRQEKWPAEQIPQAPIDLLLVGGHAGASERDLFRNPPQPYMLLPHDYSVRWVVVFVSCTNTFLPVPTISEFSVRASVFGEAITVGPAELSISVESLAEGFIGQMLCCPLGLPLRRHGDRTLRAGRT
jgi:hypothetical protein